ncbi:MAG: hypothetical protein E6614_37700, partial [Bradyrhizobium sp.]|nr:hypothetical protein [Bradyrhizobium sp.]
VAVDAWDRDEGFRRGRGKQPLLASHGGLERHAARRRRHAVLAERRCKRWLQLFSALLRV